MNAGSSSQGEDPRPERGAAPDHEATPVIGWRAGFQPWRRAASGDLAQYLIRGVSGSFGVQLAGLVFSLGSSVLLARALGPAGYGYYAFALASLEFLKVPVVYGHPLLIQRELALHSVDGDWGVIRGLLRRTSQAILLISLVLCGLLAAWVMWSGTADDVPQRRDTFLVTLLLLPLLGLSSMRSGALNGLHRVGQSLIADNIVRPLLASTMLAILWLGADMTIGPVRAMLIQLGAVAGAFLVGHLLLARAMSADLTRHRPVYHTRAWLAAAWPFMLTGGAFAAWGSIGVLALSWFRPPAEVGFYRVATLIGGLALMPITAFSLTVSPTIARLHAAGKQRQLQTVITLSTLALVAINATALAIFAIVGHTLLRLTFGAPYEAAYLAVIVILIGHLLYAGIWSVLNILDMSGHQRFSLLSLLSAALLNLLLTPLLIPTLGMVGAALATSASWLVGHLWLVPVVRVRTGMRATVFDALADLAIIRRTGLMGDV